MLYTMKYLAIWLLKMLLYQCREAPSLASRYTRILLQNALFQSPRGTLGESSNGSPIDTVPWLPLVYLRRQEDHSRQQAVLP